MRKEPLVTGEIYHIYNRGTDKRRIFSDMKDMKRFLTSIKEFNSIETIGSIRDFQREHRESNSRHPMSGIPDGLVEFVAFCLNPNHFHFLLRQKKDRGIEKFMQKLGNGYTKYFNARHSRSGVLFQGKFKSSHIDSNEYLLRASVYINLNNRFDGKSHLLSFSSWDEYMGLRSDPMCKVNIILDQFKTSVAYKSFAKDALKDIIEKKSREKQEELQTSDVWKYE
ncbi:MAG: transposase [Patescibacteria group bacterium]